MRLSTLFGSQVEAIAMLLLFVCLCLALVEASSSLESGTAPGVNYKEYRQPLNHLDKRQPPNQTSKHNHHHHPQNKHTPQHSSSEKRIKHTKADSADTKKDPKSRFHSFRKSTFHRKGLIFIGHQDWYSQYRRQRSVMRKLHIESGRRRKAMATLVPTKDNDGGTDIEFGELPAPNLDNREDEEQGGAWARYNRKLRKNGKVDEDDDDDDEKGEEDQDEDKQRIGGFRSGLDKEQGSIHTAHKRPKKFMGLPRPVVVRPAGLIPKGRSDAGRLCSGGLWRVWVSVLALGWVMAL